jgi:endonuclease V-like protein UPF0215 family
MRPLSNVIGIDDAPFLRSHRGDVGIAGAIFTRNRLDGVVVGRARRDGSDATRRIAELVSGSVFYPHLQGVILQGIAVAGFNVVDIHALSATLDRPVLVVARWAPDLAKIRRALLENVPGGARKWQLIERAGPMERMGTVYVQRAGLDRARAGRFLSDSTLHGSLPEPLRIAHLIAGGLGAGQSRGGA